MLLTEINCELNCHRVMRTERGLLCSPERVWERCLCARERERERKREREREAKFLLGWSISVVSIFFLHLRSIFLASWEHRFCFSLDFEGMRFDAATITSSFFLLLKLRSDFGFENKKKNWWINFSHGCQCSTWTTIRFDDPNVGGGSVVEHRSTDSEWLGFKSHWKPGFCLLLLLLPITSQDYKICSATTKESFVFQLYFPHSVHNRFVLHNEATFLLGNKHSCSSCSSLGACFNDPLVKIYEEKKPSYWQDSNPQPLDYKPCTLPLCCYLQPLL